MNTERTETCNCPRTVADDQDCDGKVTVVLDYEPADPHYGADADGNRSMYVAGYWYGTADDTCTLGHKLTAEEMKDIEEDAVKNVPEPEDEYWGPDGPDDEC